MKVDITGRVQDNVFYDTFEETVAFYKDTQKEIWEENLTISLFDTGSDVGLFDKSDIICVYDKDTHLPMIVTERIFRKNYSKVEWYKMKRYLRYKLAIIKQELGFNIRVSFDKQFIDYIHYKEEWWQWALKQKQQELKEQQ